MTDKAFQNQRVPTHPSLHARYTDVQDLCTVHTIAYTFACPALRTVSAWLYFIQISSLKTHFLFSKESIYLPTYMDSIYGARELFWKLIFLRVLIMKWNIRWSFIALDEPARTESRHRTERFSLPPARSSYSAERVALANRTPSCPCSKAFPLCAIRMPKKTPGSWLLLPPSKWLLLYKCILTLTLFLWPLRFHRHRRQLN